MRKFLVKIIRTTAGEVGIGIVERIDDNSIWIASIYESDATNSEALTIACRTIANELNDGECATVIFSRFIHFRTFNRIKRRFSRFDFINTNNRIREPFLLASDALNRKTSIKETLI